MHQPLVDASSINLIRLPMPKGRSPFGRGTKLAGHKPLGADSQAPPYLFLRFGTLWLGSIGAKPVGRFTGFIPLAGAK